MSTEKTPGTENFITTSTSEAEAISTQQSESSETAEAETKDENIEASDTSENEADETEQADSDNDEELTDELKGDKPKKTNGFKKRIAKLNAKSAQAEERAIRAELELKLLREQSEKGSNQNNHQVKSKNSDGKPDKNNFESYEEYEDALLDWKIDQKEKAKIAISKAEESKSAFQRKIDKHQDRIDEFKKATPDYIETINDYIEEHGALQFAMGVEESILESDLGPSIVYELAKNPEELARINSLSMVRQAAEIGKIEARLQKSQEIQKQTIKAKVPAPISPVGKGSALPTKSLSDPNISFSDYERIRKKELSAQR